MYIITRHLLFTECSFSGGSVRWDGWALLFWPVSGLFCSENGLPTSDSLSVKLTFINNRFLVFPEDRPPPSGSSGRPWTHSLCYHFMGIHCQSFLFIIPTESTNLAPKWFTETELPPGEHARADLDPLHVCDSRAAGSSCGSPNSRAGAVSDSVACLWIPFP